MTSYLTQPSLIVVLALNISIGATYLTPVTGKTMKNV